MHTGVGCRGWDECDLPQAEVLRFCTLAVPQSARTDWIPPTSTGTHRPTFRPLQSPPGPHSDLFRCQAEMFTPREEISAETSTRGGTTPDFPGLRRRAVSNLGQNSRTKCTFLMRLLHQNSLMFGCQLTSIKFCIVGQANAYYVCDESEKMFTSKKFVIMWINDDGNGVFAIFNWPSF